MRNYHYGFVEFVELYFIIVVLGKVSSCLVDCVINSGFCIFAVSAQLHTAPDRFFFNY